MKVLILGSSGIVGQHMRLCVPEGVEPTWHRRNADILHPLGIDLSGSPTELYDWLEHEKPEVIVNLAGESSVDAVERDPDKYDRINIELPEVLASWCGKNEKRLIQISSQAVFSGDNPPCSPTDATGPVNAYGRQKVLAEYYVLKRVQTVMRLTFILGIRPLPCVGRKNPLEAMIEGQSPQVADRWFSPLMAWDAAWLIWKEVTEPSGDPIIHCGSPERWSRYELAKQVSSAVDWCHHSDFPGIAPRPRDTTYAGVLDSCSMSNQIATARGIAGFDRAVELALFFGMRHEHAHAKLSQGFGPLHNAVSDEWRAVNPQTEGDILEFYRRTDTYIWELSAYHEDPGWNYSGMCDGIATRLKNEPDCKSVLCLGDGIGDLTLTLHRAGFEARYHDLDGSRTAKYAAFRFWRQTGKTLDMSDCTSEPIPSDNCDAIVSLDFLEHVTDVEAWMLAIHTALRSGGLFCAQNAFACGSGPDGAMPMHLACNDRFEKDWDPLLTAIGFEQLAPQWYRKRI